MKIAILDDYQDAVRKLDCFHLLADQEVKVFNNTVRGLGQLASRLSEVDALVLIRERTRINSQLLDKLPRLRMISQTGKAGGAHRYRRLYRARNRRAGRHRLADRARRADLGADHGGAAPHSAIRGEPEARRVAAVGAEDVRAAAEFRSGPGFARADARHLGLRQDRPARRGLWQGVRDERADLGPRTFAGSWRANDGYDVAESREALFEQSDVLSLHLRMHDDTRGIVTQQDLMRMKPTALLRQHEPRRTARGKRAGERAAPQPAGDGRHRRL